MSSRTDRAQKSQRDKHHTILRELVQEPTNKTCAECLAKGMHVANFCFVCLLVAYLCIYTFFMCKSILEIGDLYYII